MPVTLSEAELDGAALHVAICVRSIVDPSVKLPIAESCSDKPTGIDDGLGLMVMEESAALVTVTEAFPVMLWYCAETWTDPVANPFSIPAVLTETSAAGVALQVTDEVTSDVDPSVKVPVTESCS